MDDVILTIRPILSFSLIIRPFGGETIIDPTSASPYNEKWLWAPWLWDSFSFENGVLVNRVISNTEEGGG